MQQSDLGDVVDVVARTLGQWSVLPVSRDTGIDQARIGRLERGRAEPESVGHARTEALDHDVCAIGELTCGGDTDLALEVEDEPPRSPTEDVDALSGYPAIGEDGATGPLDADELRTEIGEDHRAKRRRSDATEIEYPQPEQRARFLHTQTIWVSPPVHRRRGRRTDGGGAGDLQLGRSATTLRRCGKCP